MQIPLSDRFVSTYMRLRSSEVLPMLRGIDPNMEEVFADFEIRSPLELLLQGQTPRDRETLARALIRQEWENVSSEDEASLLPGYVRRVEFVVREADLLRLTEEPEEQFLLAEAGVRGCADFSNSDMAKLNREILNLSAKFPNMRAPSLSKLYELYRRQIPSAYILLNEERSENFVVPHEEELEYKLNEWENAGSIAEKRRIQSIIEDRYGRDDERHGTQALRFAFLYMQYDGPEASFLIKHHMVRPEQSSSDRTDTEILCEGLKFLQNITVALPLPRTISGRLTMKKDLVSNQTVPMSGCKVQVSGIADSKDPQPDDEDAFCYTDQDGFFMILMPERYNMKERITLTVSENQLQSSRDMVSMSDAANSEHQMTFIRRASEIMDAEYIWANRRESDPVDVDENVLLRYRNANKDPKLYKLKSAREVLRELDRLQALTTENIRLKSRIREKALIQQRIVMQKIRIRDELQTYQSRISDLIRELQAHRADCEAPAREIKKKIEENSMKSVEQRKFWVLCYHQHLYLRTLYEELVREDQALRPHIQEHVLRTLCAVVNQKWEDDRMRGESPNCQPLYVPYLEKSMVPEELWPELERLRLFSEQWNAAKNLALCSAEEFAKISDWHNAYFGEESGTGMDKTAARELENELPKLTKDNRAVYEETMRVCEETYLARTDYFEGVYGGANSAAQDREVDKGIYSLYYLYDPIDYDRVRPDDFMTIRDEETAVHITEKDLKMDLSRIEEQVDIFQHLIRKATEEREAIKLPKISEEEQKNTLNITEDWLMDLPTMEQYGVKFSHYLEKGLDRLRDTQDVDFLENCGNMRRIIDQYEHQQRILEQTWDNVTEHREKELLHAADNALDAYMQKVLKDQSDADVVKFNKNQKICDDIMGMLYDLDETTNNVEQTVRNFLSSPMDAYLGDMVLIESAFRGKGAKRRTLPSVRLMGEGKDAVYLPTDTAPSRIFNFSMMQRLVEPTLTRMDGGNQAPMNQKSAMRNKLIHPINVMKFRKNMRENQSEILIASSLGMGYTLNMHQAWIPDGFALGDLLYSLVLAPGEEQRLIVKEHKEDYQISDDAFAEDGITDLYVNRQDDDESAVFDQGAKRYSGAHSDYAYKTAAESSGTSVCLGLGSFSQASATNKGSGSSNASQRDSYDEASTAVQNFQTAIKTEASRLATAKRASIRIAGSEDSESLASKIVANHNHSHVMTVQYWEVTRRYRMETCIDSIDLTLFVPLQPLHFLPEPSQLARLKLYGDYYLPLELSSGRNGGQTNAYLGFTREAFNYRYSNILPYADTLLGAVPYRYRSGLRLMQRFAAMPEWTVSSSSSANARYEVKIKGRFLEIDRFWAKLEVDGLNRPIDGKVSTFSPNTHHPSMNSRQDLLYALHGLRDGIYYSRYLVQNDQHDAKKERETYTKYHSARIAEGFDIKEVTITFYLPAGVTENDIQRLVIGRDLSDYQIKLCQDRKYLNTAEREAVDNYYHKEKNLYEDDDKSDYDRDKMDHFWDGMPECYRKPIATLSSADQLSTGPCEIEAYCNGSKTPLQGSLNGSPVTFYPEKRIPKLTYEDFMEMERSLHHISDQTLRYSQVIWSSLSDDERIMMLEEYTVEMDFDAILSDQAGSQENVVDVPLLS